MGASEGGTRNERILLCPWQQTEVAFFPLEPSDDFREFSFYQDCGYGAVEQLSVFGKIRYLFASSISLLSASSLLQS